MLRYMALDPDDRRHHHNLITFSLVYAFSENFVLPLSHDEVVHGKRSLLNKMSGTYEQKFAQLRLFYGYWMTHPGKKLLFMGGEWGQFDEWKDAESLDWMLLDYHSHGRMHHYVRTLNAAYARLPSLWERDCEQGGFEWIDVHNAAQSIVVFMRRGHHSDQFTITVCNFSHHQYNQFIIGVPEPGQYRIVLNSEAAAFGGTWEHFPYLIDSRDVPWHGRESSLALDLPPLSFQLLTYSQGVTPLPQRELY
jgi:1,4-alpha-glucan branching enzyme